MGNTNISDEKPANEMAFFKLKMSSALLLFTEMVEWYWGLGVACLLYFYNEKTLTMALVLLLRCLAKLI